MAQHTPESLGHDDSSTLTTRARRRNLVAVIVSLTVAALTHGLTLPLLALVLDQHGVASSAIGISTAAQYLSVFLVAPVMPRLLALIGPVRLMFWSVLFTAATLVALRLHVEVYYWFAVRFLMGIALSFIWISGEALINHVAEEHARGRAIAAYTMAAASGFALGPVILMLAGSEGWMPFSIAAAVMVIASVPLYMVLEDSPKIEGQPSASLPHYVLLAPVAMLVYLAFAATDSILLALLPLYGIQSGLPEPIAVTLLTAMAIGAIVWQPLVGRLADRVDRSVLTAVSLVIMLTATAALPLVIASAPWNALFMFLFGGGLGALYTISMVLLGERFKGADLSAAATVFAVMFCVGSMIGPPIAGLGMEHSPQYGLPLVMAGIFLLVLPLPVIERLRRRSG